jgi:release factor glutamine methyltransferase
MSASLVATGVSLGELRRRAWNVLKAAGVANPAREADWLLAHTLELPSHALLLEGERTVSARQAERSWALIRRRASREPLQYLLGTQEFRGLDMAVTPDVLIPRPETELLVEETLRIITDVGSPRLADVGTGSGCLAVTVVRERPDATIYALDISAPALAVARANAIRHGTLDRIRFVQADLLGAFSVRSRERFDVIVSNPPYIPVGELEGLQPEVARYEPRVALAAGSDGLTYHRRLLKESLALLKPGGCLIVELGYGQADSVMSLARSSGAYDSVVCRKDAAGIERVLVARRSGREGA